MAIPFVTGQRLTADLLNANLVDPVNETTAEKPIGRVTQSVAQSLADATFTAITFTTQEYDTHDFHSTSSNTSRITPTLAGYYRFTGTVSFEGTATPVAVDAHWRKNGSNSAAGTSRVIGATTILGVQVTATIAMDGVSDYMELMGRQDSAGADNTQVNLPITSVAEWEFVRPL